MDPRRQAIRIGLALVGVSVLSGLLFVGFVLSGQNIPDRPPEPEPVAPVPTASSGPMQSRLDRLSEAAKTERPLREAAADLVGDNGVVCGIAPRVDVGTARLTLTDEDTSRGWLAVAASRGDVLVLSDIPESGQGTLFVEGFAPTPVRWFDARQGKGGCDPDPVELGPPEASVVGRIEGFAIHETQLAVEACGQPVTLDGEGGFFVAAVPGEACEVAVRRHYGVWEYRDTVTLTPAKGDDAQVTLQVPDFTAVLPLKVADGRIVAVWSDDEELEGLVGTKVVRVDGEAADDDVDEFFFATGGEPGEAAEIEVVDDAGTAIVRTLHRRALSFDDWLVR